MIDATTFKGELNYVTYDNKFIKFEISYYTTINGNIILKVIKQYNGKIDQYFVNMSNREILREVKSTNNNIYLAKTGRYSIIIFPKAPHPNSIINYLDSYAKVIAYNNTSFIVLDYEYMHISIFKKIIINKTIPLFILDEVRSGNITLYKLTNYNFEPYNISKKYEIQTESMTKGVSTFLGVSILFVIWVIMLYIVRLMAKLK